MKQLFGISKDNVLVLLKYIDVLLFKKLQQRMERHQESFLLLLCRRAESIAGIAAEK